MTPSSTPTLVTADPAGRPGASTPAATSTAKADLGKRFLAALIDGGLSLVVGLVPVVGGLLVTAYWLVRDGLAYEFMDHRSIGKTLMKLRPVSSTGGPVDLATSIKRNWVFALGGLIQVLMFIPVAGWMLAIPVALAALVLAIVEVAQVVVNADGRRLGDKLAGTRVVEVAA